MGHSIFINYRRDDTSSDAGRIHESIEQKFGAESVFLDIDDIAIGSKWKQVLENAGKDAKVLLVLIGDQWLKKQDNGRPRLFNEGDWVRLEIESALEKEMIVIPVLLKGAKLPSIDDLPPSIHQLLEHQCIEMRYDRWTDDMGFLLKKVGLKIYNKPRYFLTFYWKHLFGIAASICLGASLFYYIMYEPADALKPSPVDFKPPIDSACYHFKLPLAFKTLIFPILTESNDAEKWQSIIDIELKNKCEPKIKTEIRFANENTKKKSSAEKKEIAQSCGADLYISGTELNSNLALNYGFTDDHFDQLLIDESLELKQTNIVINDFTHSINQSYSEVICLITGMYFYKINKYQEAIIALKSCHYNSDEKLINGFIADSYYKLNQFDSSLVYIERIEHSKNDSLALLLKKAAIAEKAGKSDKAIVAYTKALEKEKSSAKKAKILERRGDQYKKVDDLQNAKADYTKSKVIKPNAALNDKIRSVDKKINDNATEIKPSSNSNIKKLTNTQHVEAALQNGNFNLASDMIKELEAKGTNGESLKVYKLEIEMSKMNNGVLPSSATTVNPAAIEKNKRLKTKIALAKAKSIN